jgi:hypothetical protein
MCECVRACGTFVNVENTNSDMQEKKEKNDGLKTRNDCHWTGEVVSNSLKIGVDLREEWIRSKLCCTVVPLARILVLLRLKSRLKSCLKTSFSSEMTLSTLESGPMILPLARNDIKLFLGY